MSLFGRVKNRVKKKIESFSGEYSSEAPEDRPDYHRPGVANEDAEVPMAILHGVGGRKNVYSKGRKTTGEAGSKADSTQSKDESK